MNKYTLAILLSSFVVLGCSSYKENISRAPANMDVTKVCVLHNAGKTGSYNLQNLMIEALENRLIKNEVILSKADAVEKNCSHLIQYTTRGNDQVATKLRITSAVVSETGSLTKVAEVKAKGKLYYSDAKTKNIANNYITQLLGQ